MAVNKSQHFPDSDAVVARLILVLFPSYAQLLVQKETYP